MKSVRFINREFLSIRAGSSARLEVIELVEITSVMLRVINDLK